MFEWATRGQVFSLDDIDVLACCHGHQNVLLCQYCSTLFESQSIVSGCQS